MMRSRSNSSAILLLLILMALGISCLTQEICDDNPQSELVVRFKIQEDEVIRDSILTDLSVYGIREGKPDSLLYDSMEVSRIVLPLDPHHTYSSFVLQAGGETDTLYIGHNTGFYLMSYTCGYAAIFTLDPDSIIHGNTLFYDVEIKSAVIDAHHEQNEEHIWLYF